MTTTDAAAIGSESWTEIWKSLASPYVLECKAYPEQYELLSTELGESLFASNVAEYFSACGLEQKNKRQSLLTSLKNSPALDDELQQILSTVSEVRSQEAIEAAIDLLTPLGEKVVSLAEKMAYSERSPDATAGFVVAFAAGRCNPHFATTVLIYSAHEAIREGAVEMLADFPSLQAKPLLRQIAQSDPAAYLRSRAAELLEDFAAI